MTMQPQRQSEIDETAADEATTTDPADVANDVAADAGEPSDDPVEMDVLHLEEPADETTADAPAEDGEAAREKAATVEDTEDGEADGAPILLLRDTDILEAEIFEEEGEDAASDDEASSEASQASEREATDEQTEEPSADGTAPAAARTDEAETPSGPSAHVKAMAEVSESADDAGWGDWDRLHAMSDEDLERCFTMGLLGPASSRRSRMAMAIRSLRRHERTDFELTAWRVATEDLRDEAEEARTLVQSMRKDVRIAIGVAGASTAIAIGAMALTFVM